MLFCCRDGRRITVWTPRPRQSRKIRPMEPTTACCVIVVAETDKLNRLAQSAVEKMGAKLVRLLVGKIKRPRHPALGDYREAV